MATIGEVQKRSVDNLQRLYTVVVSLAIVENVRGLFGDLSHEPTCPSLAKGLMALSLMFTIVPFYHGANRYLDVTYVEKTGHAFPLMLDFVFLFIEGAALFVLACFSSNESFFYTTLASLLLFDSIWVALTYVSRRGPILLEPPNIWKWAILNVITSILLFIVVRFDLWVSYASFALVALRTVLDYRLMWDLYYPKESGASVTAKT